MRAFRIPILLLAALSLTSSAFALSWPTSDAALTSELHSHDEAVRIRALRRVKILGRPRALAEWQKALGESSPITLVALQASVELRPAELSDDVIELLRAKDPKIREAACAWLAEVPSDGQRSALLRASGDSDPDVRRAALRSLSRFSDEEALTALLGRLDDPIPTVRAQAATLLGERGDIRALGPLSGHVQDPHVDVRMAAARALGELGDPRAGAALVLALRDSQSTVVIEAIYALGEVSASSAASALVARLNGADRHAAYAAALALGQLRTPDATLALTARLGTSLDTDPMESPIRMGLRIAGVTARDRVRAILATGTRDAATSAASVLADIGDETDGARIADALSRARIRSADGLAALARRPDASGLAVALRALSSDRKDVRSAAIGALHALLGQSDGRAAEPIAAELDRATSPNERATLTVLLGKTGAIRYFARLEKALRSKHSSEQQAALAALEYMRSPEADELLVQSLARTEPTLRQTAMQVLRRAGGRAARDTLLHSLTHEAGIDAPLALAALVGPLSRNPDPDAIRFLADLESTLSTDERWAAREALALTSPKTAALWSSSEDEAARRLVAVSAGAWPGPACESTSLGFLGDRDEGVRVHALASLARCGTPNARERLLALAQDPSPRVVAHVLWALSRVPNDDVRKLICERASDARTLVRANALAAAAVARASCDPKVIRASLRVTTSSIVRYAAALAAHATGAEKLLGRCASRDPDAIVKAACGGIPKLERRETTDVYAVGPVGAKIRNVSVYLQRPDGFVRVAWTDARGVAVDVGSVGDWLTLVAPTDLQ